jgi:uncharacterized protein YbjT (DUF2867 family)
MRILVVGAYGLIGSYVTARLLAEGCEVTGVGREVSSARRRFPQVRWVQADLRRMDAASWAPMLDGVEAVVNCAGALQDSPRDDLLAVHAKATAALAEACAAAGVGRFVQISAVGVERGRTAFERTKLAADEALKASGLEWVILRPGLVLAPAAYGGSGLLRGLAALPIAMPAANPDAVVQVVSVEDVAEAVAQSVMPGAPARYVCDLAAAETTRLRDVLSALRAWLGLRSAPVWPVPGLVARAAGMTADGLAWLGWRGPMRTAALRQLEAGVTGGAQDAENRLGLSVKGLDAILAGWPAGVQERWYARLYFLKPAAPAVLAAFWAVSGLVGLTEGAAAARLLIDAGFVGGAARTAVLAGSLVDLGLAALVCARPTARLALRGMILVTVAYLAAATFWLPQLWADPLGPLVKSIPAALLAALALAMMDER